MWYTTFTHFVNIRSTQFCLHKIIHWITLNNQCKLPEKLLPFGNPGINQDPPSKTFTYRMAFHITVRLGQACRFYVYIC